MSEEKMKNKKVWIIVFWTVLTLAVIGGIVYFAWNYNGKTTKTPQKETACTTVVADGNANTVTEVTSHEVQLTAANYDAEVLQAKGVVLVDVYAPWCPHCQRISTKIAKIAEDYAGRIKVGTMNANNQDSAMKANFDYALQNGLQGYPTIWIYKDGKIVDSFSGEKTYCEIKEMVDKQL